MKTLRQQVCTALDNSMSYSLCVDISGHAEYVVKKPQIGDFYNLLEY
jgi:hypothetical protein